MGASSFIVTCVQGASTSRLWRCAGLGVHMCGRRAGWFSGRFPGGAVLIKRARGANPSPHTLTLALTLIIPNPNPNSNLVIAGANSNPNPCYPNPMSRAVSKRMRLGVITIGAHGAAVSKSMRLGGYN